jgi:hypothetical protein
MRRGWIDLVLLVAGGVGGLSLLLLVSGILGADDEVGVAAPHRATVLADEL